MHTTMSQRSLIKLNSSETLQGRESSAAKSEYQANYDELRQLKKYLFRVSSFWFRRQKLTRNTYRSKHPLFVSAPFRC
jgi:hypothetical protein